jgi:DNA mismatch repair protein MutL
LSGCRPTSPTRSPRAKWSSVLPRSSRNWSRTRSTLARGASRSPSSRALRTSEDLGQIATLGFRGEALPAVASVSHFTLRTRPQDATVGVEVSVEAGAPAIVREVGAPAGTAVEVRDLFFNLPARRKFLKSDAAEMAQVTRVVTQMALGYIEVGFALVAPGRRRLEFPPVASLADRLFQVYGDRPDLVPVARRTAGLAIEGMVAALAANGLPRGPQHVFVNRRMVRDKTIAHAIGEAYSAASIKERSPEVHLFLEIPLETVDVNVHPTKAEVRFRDQSFIHQSVRLAVADALGGATMPALPQGPARPIEPQASSLPLPTAYPTVFPSRWTSAAEAGIKGVHLELPATFKAPGSGRRWGSFATPSSWRWTRRGLRSSTSTSRTNACSSSGSPIA